jgi:hypothetical protein
MGETTRPDPPLNDLAHYMKRVHDLSAELREREAELEATRQRAEKAEGYVRRFVNAERALNDAVQERRDGSELHELSVEYGFARDNLRVVAAPSPEQETRE